MGRLLLYWPEGARPKHSATVQATRDLSATLSGGLP